MASPLSIRLPQRALAIAIAVSSEFLLASFSLALAADVGVGTDTRAGNTVSFVTADALDDSVLARGPSDRPGSITVSVIPEAMSSKHSVTLWDELARPAPAPLPVPIDTTGTMQSNAVSNSRK